MWVLSELIDRINTWKNSIEQTAPRAKWVNPKPKEKTKEEQEKEDLERAKNVIPSWPIYKI